MVYAWSYAIHRSVVEDVEKQLIPGVRERLQQLLGPEPLAFWADWADKQNIYPKSWHHVTWEAIDTSCDPMRDHLACALDALVYKKYGVEYMPLHHRIQLLLHLVIDAHQPLHVDKTGFANPRCYVYIKKKRMNLHQWMDGGVLGGKAAYLSVILPKERISITQIKNFSSKDVLKENAVYWDMIYPQYQGLVPYYCYKHAKTVPNISKNNQKALAHLMVQRLALASKRLAYILNTMDMSS